MKDQRIQKFSPSRRSRIRNWIRLSERAHFSILISAFKMPRVVKTGLDMITSYFRKSKIHVLLEQHDDLFVHYSALRKFWCISCYSFKTKIEACSLHLQFTEGAQFSYSMILHRQSFPGISWEAKKQFICCLFAIIMIIKICEETSTKLNFDLNIA